MRHFTGNAAYSLSAYSVTAGEMLDGRAHIGIGGHYSFHLPGLGGAHRPLRDPDAPEEQREATTIARRTGNPAAA